jgi:hypothetical protein
MRHHVPGRTGRQRLTTIIAALTVILTFTGLIAAITSPARAQTTPAGQPAATSAATTATQDSTAILTARLHAATAAADPIYTVHRGDSISGVARQMCGQADNWTGIYAASRAAHLTAANANSLTVGQHLAIACTYDARQLRYATAPAAPHLHVHLAARVRARDSHGRIWGVTYGYPNLCGDGDGDGYDIRCTQLHRHTVTGATATRRTFTARAARRSTGSFGNVSPSSYRGFQQCVITRESGGNSQVMNSSGHYGLYQFSASTWAAYGGSSGTFGHASVAEQNRVFANAMARGGQSNWSPYDGC